jgi:hypothetical protein
MKAPKRCRMTSLLRQLEACEWLGFTLDYIVEPVLPGIGLGVVDEGVAMPRTVVSQSYSVWEIVHRSRFVRPTFAWHLPFVGLRKPDDLVFCSMQVEFSECMLPSQNEMQVADTSKLGGSEKRY